SMRLDVWAYAVGVIGGLILAFAGAHGFQNKSITIVAFGLGAIFLVIGGCLYWQDAIWKNEAAILKPSERPYLVLNRVTCDLDAMNSEDSRLVHVTVENVTNTIAFDFTIISHAFLLKRELSNPSEAPDFNTHQTPSKQPF